MAADSSGSFTAVNDTLVHGVVDRDEDVTITISGTYNMEIELQREVGALGSGSWEFIKTYKEANATVSDVYVVRNQYEHLRLFVRTYTSGTATVGITDGDHHLQQFWDEQGNLTYTITQAKIKYEKTVEYGGGITMSGAISGDSFLDEDDMASDSATAVASQQSIKKYVDDSADGVATTVTITDNESTDEENAIIFTSGGELDGGTLGLESDGDLKYNPSTGTLTSTVFAGALTGNVTGNVTGTLDGSLGSGEAAAASVTTLAVSGAISGTSFKDENDMASDSATAVASQQSIKAYVDTEVAGASGGLPTDFIGGLQLSNDADGDHDVNITAGSARDDADAADIILASEITKQIDASWSVGDDAGGMDTGSVGATLLYAVWLIRRSDTGVEDALFSLSFTSPTMPASYDEKRLIGAVKTDGSNNIIAFTHIGNYFRYTGDVIGDLGDATITHGSYETGTIPSVPPSCLAHLYVMVSNPTSTGNEDWRLTLRTAGAADSHSGNHEGVIRIDSGTGITAANRMGVMAEVLVDSSQQVDYAANEITGSTAVLIETVGFWMLTRDMP